MLRLPESPRSRTTRYLECISCHEPFAISESFINSNFSRSRRSRNRSRQIADRMAWRAAPHHPLHLDLPPLVWNGRHTVYPVPRAEPRNRTTATNTVLDDPIHLNCPRCGADNRNWAQITDHPKASSVFDGVPLAATAVFLLIVAILLAYAVLFVMYSQRRSMVLWQAVPLGLALLVVLVGPVASLARRWRAVLEHQRLRQHLPQVSKRNPLWIPALAWLGSVIFIVPIGLFYVLPVALDFLITDQTEIAVWKLEELRSSLEFEEGVLAPRDAEAVQAIIQDINEIINTLSASALQRQKIQAVVERVDALTLPEGTDVDAQLRDLKAYLESTKTPADTSTAFWEQPRPLAKFLILWFALTGVVGIGSTFIGWTLAEHYAEQANRHLPPPIYSCAAKMTRVALWDAVHTLEISENLDKAHWHHVERTGEGGLLLRGIYREDLDDALASDPQKPLMAYQYAILTDRWAHVVRADVDEQMLRPPSPPNGQNGAGPTAVPIHSNGARPVYRG